MALNQSSSLDCNEDEEDIVIVKSDSEDEAQECNCIIDELLVKPFLGREYGDKFNIITNGRPTPTLIQLTSKTRMCTRRFNPVTYDTYKWLCGCENKLRLFCWPCILFAKDINQWTYPGISDLNNLHNLMKRHETTITHISALMSLKSFGHGVDENFRVDITKFNRLVKKNRHVVTKLIDVTCVLAELELPFNSDYEATSRGSNFTEFINLLRQYDDNLDTHMSNSNAFSRFSGDLQNDLIDSIYQVVMDDLKDRIAEADFIALILDETTDSGNKCHIAKIVRFGDKEGHVHERFLGFTELPINTFLAPYILNMINDLKISSRLISISYNGPSFMSQKNNLLIQKIKYQNPGLYFVHHYSNKFFFSIKNIVDHISECKSFFWTLMGLASFFTESSQRSFALHQEIRKRYPTHSSIRWDLNSNLLKSVIFYKVDILNVFESINENPTKWDMDTYNSAKGFRSAIKELEFNFLLHLFGDIFPEKEFLSELLQGKIFDIEDYRKGIEEFEKHLDNLKYNYDDFWLQVNEVSLSTHESIYCKRIKIEDQKENYLKLYREVINCLLSEINYDRLNEIENLNFIYLLDPNSFENYLENFPNRNLFYLKKSVYGRLFDINKLKTELMVVYKDRSFWKKDVYELYEFLCSTKITEIIPEVGKLAQMVVTLPVSPGSSDITFSASKRIKTFLENSQVHESLPSLALLSIEKDLLSSLKVKPLFHDKVINRFGTKIRHIELSYK